MVGLLTYLPTTAYFPQFFFLVAFLYVLIRDRERLLSAFYEFKNSPKHLINWNFLIIILIIVLSTINRLIHLDSVDNMAELFPYFILLIPTYIIAISFSESDAKVLVALVAVEGVVVALEWGFGISTFDHALSGFKTFEEGGLAYFHRPLGLSISSSHIASKLFLAWLMIDFFKFKGEVWVLVKIILLAAVVMTFNRSVLLSMSIYIAIYYSVSFLKLNYRIENAVVGLIAGIIGFIGVVTVVVAKGQGIINQLTRNTGKVELTGREYLWADFYAFIQEHLIFGNYSVKLWMDGYHAHNSYIEVIATNGIFIALVYFVLIYRNIKKSNWVYVIPILIFGMTQYAFFWGISLFDILFWVILFKVFPVQKKEIIQKPIEIIPL